ncbi:MarR family transcriptional regulator [Sandarakinorhabdus sp.]|jgi:DNA-binding MarR family transcriptional regulator|uniref:MarR family winged helix-turn-helix transcriptional regulator n=1 Tax=Sandarakinorhabdus sp. TaxID=1916663 RepID=UPI003340E7CD
MDDPLADLPGYVLRRASIATMGRLHRHISAHDLRATEASLILLIGERAGLTQSEAGRILGIKRANMVPLTARLEARGLVERLQLTGRSQELALTTAGKLMQAEVRASVVRHEAEIMARVPEALRPHVMPILTALWGPERDER